MRSLADIPTGTWSLFETDLTNNDFPLSWGLSVEECCSMIYRVRNFFLTKTGFEIHFGRKTNKNPTFEFLWRHCLLRFAILLMECVVGSALLATFKLYKLIIFNVTGFVTVAYTFWYNLRPIYERLMRGLLHFFVSGDI